MKPKQDGVEIISEYIRILVAIIWKGCQINQLL